MPVTLSVLWLCLFFPIVLAAQSQDTSPVTFHVNAPVTEYSIFPEDSLLFAEKPNPILLRVKGRRRELSVSLNGAMLRPSPGNDSLFTIFVRDTGSMAMLTVVEKITEDNFRIVLSKPYRIRRSPLPVALVCGVKADSSIDKQQLILDDILYARSEQYGFPLRVCSFDMVFDNGTKRDTLHSKNNHFTLEQRRQIYRMKPGNILCFENIICLLPKGQTQKLRPVRLRLKETNKYKVAYRKTGN